MPLARPPAPYLLSRLVSRRLPATLYRVFRTARAQPWWFSSVGPDQPDNGGRFDLPSPAGSCYLGASRAAALLEAFQDFGAGLLPDVELYARRMAEVSVPSDAPPAAVLTSQRARGVGVTAALWAGADRSLTQLWAAALYRAGWRALFHGIQHDPAGRLRAVTLFDTTGEHPPYDDHAGWTLTAHGLWPSASVERSLARFGITVARSELELPFVALHESGLLQ